MNYFIRGGAANADKIKAAFERLGYDVKGWAFTSGLYYTLNGKIVNTSFGSNEYELVLNNPDYKELELELPVEPKFKVGDWVVKKGGETFYGGNYAEQITLIENDGYLKCIWLSSGTWVRDNDIRLWSIQDAKDGDVLVSGIDNPFIYDGNIEFSFAGAYVGVSRNGRIRLDMFPSKAWTSIKGVKPATKEECDLLFAKMREAGYEWDAGKKELRKTIDEPTFKVGDWIIRNNGSSDVPIQIYGLKKDRYLVTNLLGSKGELMINRQDEWHLWTIEDVIDGDVLVLNGKPFIYSHNKYGKNYCYIDDCGQFRANFNLVFEGNCVCPATKQERDLLFYKMREVGYKWDEKKKELLKIIEPNFKVGDWITDGISKCQIHLIDNTQYWYSENCILGSIESVNKRYHLWSIADAKDGDILSAKIDGDDYILIFKQIKDGWIETYGHYYITIDKFCAPTQMFCRNYQGRLYPATQEQYKTLFKKMHDDGYEWDFDKKELRKIQPHYDIANFKPKQWVLVRDGDDDVWEAGFYGRYNVSSKHFVGSRWSRQCIPFEGNEKLLGTTDMPDECYINW